VCVCVGGKIDRIVSCMEDVKEEFRKQNKWKEMIEEKRRDCKTQRKEWEREREEMKGDMRDLKKRLEILEQNERQEKGERQRWREGEGKNMMEKIKRIEKSMESRKREKRRRNIIIKGMEAKEGKRREESSKKSRKKRTRIEKDEGRRDNRRRVKGSAASICHSTDGMSGENREIGPNRSCSNSPRDSLRKAQRFQAASPFSLTASLPRCKS